MYDPVDKDLEYFYNQQEILANIIMNEQMEKMELCDYECESLIAKYRELGLSEKDISIVIDHNIKEYFKDV